MANLHAEWQGAEGLRERSSRGPSHQIMCDYFFMITPSNQTCDGGVSPLQGVRLLVMSKVPVAPAYCKVPPATRMGTP